MAFGFPNSVGDLKVIIGALGERKIGVEGPGCWRRAFRLTSSGKT